MNTAYVGGRPKLKEYISYYLKPLVFSTLLFFLLLLTFQYALVGDGIEIYGWGVLSDENNIFEESTLPKKFYKALRQPSTVVIRALVNQKVQEEKTTRYLYISQIDASYFAVKVDGNIVGSFGFSEGRTGHVWYQPFLFQIPEYFKTIEFEISGVYEIGIDFPVKIVNGFQRTKYAILHFLTVILIPFSAGLIFTLSIILYLLSKTTSDVKRKIYSSLAIASFLGCVWMFDLFPFPTLGNLHSFLILRKIFTASAYVGFAFLIKGIVNQYFNKVRFVDKLMMILNLLAALSISLAPSNYHLKILTNNIALLLFANAFYLVSVAIKTYSPTIFGFVLFFVLTIIHDGAALFFSTNTKFLSHFGIIALFFGFSYIIVTEYRDMTLRITTTHLKSIMDPLTGAYNRGVLSELTLSPKDSVVYVDMDKFKIINDNYGHEIGDEILKLLVRTIKNNVRSSDYIVRMGGDEFLVVLKDCPVSKAEEIFSKVQSEFTNSHELRPVFSFGASQYNGSLHDTIRAVDKLMYEMKAQKSGYSI